jgi:hypothetical protein
MLMLEVVVAAIFLTIPFEIGFGRESLAEKFLLMVPSEEKVSGVTGKSLGPVSNLVKAIMNWDKKEENDGNQMIVD